MSFENNLKRLELIVGTLENGECKLDEAMALFEEGIGISKDCNKQLEKAKQLITAIDEEEISENNDD